MSQDYPEIVQLIHKDFENASDVLVAEAKAVLANTSVSKKKALLEEIGFTTTPEYKKYSEQLKQMEDQNTLIGAIVELKQKFPFHKAINLETIIKICKKYNLVYGDSKLYKGFIPEKNAKEIDNFKKSYPKECTRYAKSHLFTGNVEEITEEVYSANVKSPGIIYRYDKVTKPFMIVAPETDMNMTGKMIKDFKVVNRPIPPDPVVLLPVKSKGIQMYLILTKWGDEASDPELSDFTMN